MPGSEESLFWIALCAVIAPLASGLIFRHRVPEVVLLLVLGVLIGPNALELATQSSGIDVLSQLGLGMLFLLAGYEIDAGDLVRKAGRRAMVTWLGCLAVAMLVVLVAGELGVVNAEIAVAIALTSTAFGTLLPILKDNGVLTTPFGQTLMKHGAFGELGPVIAIAVLLGVHGPVESLVVLVLFGLLTVLVHRFSARLNHEGSSILLVVRRGADTSGQTQVRLVVLLLVTLGVAASVFDLDLVLGSFAAGFVLRALLPEGHSTLEHKLEGLAFGLLIPVFFITSGMAIDPRAIVEEPADLAAFVFFILAVRGGGVYVATRTTRVDGTRVFDRRESAAMGLFAATGLPIIVAVTTVAVGQGQMTPTNASVLVAGGALTVLICPFLAQALLTRRAHPEQVIRGDRAGH
jgi:Kef-type K+ transport system membrane component KefB